MDGATEPFAVLSSHHTTVGKSTPEDAEDPASSSGPCPTPIPPLSVWVWNRFKGGLSMRFPRASRGDRSLTSQPRGPALSSAWASAATHMQPGEHALSEGGWGGVRTFLHRCAGMSRPDLLCRSWSSGVWAAAQVPARTLGHSCFQIQRPLLFNVPIIQIQGTLFSQITAGTRGLEGQDTVKQAAAAQNQGHGRQLGCGV